MRAQRKPSNSDNGVAVANLPPRTAMQSEESLLVGRNSYTLLPSERVASTMVEPPLHRGNSHRGSRPFISRKSFPLGLSTDAGEKSFARHRKVKVSERHLVDTTAFRTNENISLRVEDSGSTGHDNNEFEFVDHDFYEDTNDSGDGFMDETDILQEEPLSRTATIISSNMTLNATLDLTQTQTETETSESLEEYHTDGGPDNYQEGSEESSTEVNFPEDALITDEEGPISCRGIACFSSEKTAGFVAAFLLVLLAICYQCRKYCKRRRDERGEYRQVAEQYEEMLFADNFDDDYSVGADDNQYDEDDLEDNWTAGPASKKTIELSNVNGNGEGLSLEEVNG